jgi:hypothetical protein
MYQSFEYGADIVTNIETFVHGLDLRIGLGGNYLPRQDHCSREETLRKRSKKRRRN